MKKTIPLSFNSIELIGCAMIGKALLDQQSELSDNDILTRWIKNNKFRLSIRAIEKEIGCPSTTLSKVANDTMKLPKKWEQPLAELISKMCAGKEK